MRCWLATICLFVSVAVPARAERNLAPVPVADRAPEIKAPNEVKELVKEIHRLIDGGGDEEHRTWLQNIARVFTREGAVEWLKAFNLKTLAINSYRVYHIKGENPRFKEHVSNLVFAFPLSHAIEMSSGPLIGGLAAWLGMPDTVVGGAGLGGAIISIPGLDPICLMIYSSYPVSRRLQNAISFLRLKTMSVLTFVGTYSGLKKLGQITRGIWFQHWWETSAQAILAHDGGIELYADSTLREWLLHLDYHPRAPEYLVGVTFNPRYFSALTDKEWKKLLKPLPYNVRAAVEEARHVLARRRPAPFYTRFAVYEDFKVIWKDRAVATSVLSSLCVEHLRGAPPPGR